MKFLEKIVVFLKWFGGLHFAIKWNIGVMIFVAYSFLFGAMTLSSFLLIVAVANLYALPMYIAVLRGMGFNGDVLLVIALGVLLLGYFTSFYLTALIWIVVMVFLFRQELFSLIGMIKK